MKVNRLKRNDPSYPEVLAQIPNAPKELFYLGARLSDWIGKPRVAIVGSRKISAYGRQVTERLSSELARQGVVIISGLALGVDSVAHRAALDAQGLTVAVLPTSLNKIYPASHANLAKQICETGGSLISEYPAGGPTFKTHFTERNRIVSGLADAVLITEAAAKSGTMNTARFALEQGKTVLAVPGNITNPMSEGTNNLIKSGALPVTDVSDIFFALNINPKKTKQEKIFIGDPLEEKVFGIISRGVSLQEEIAIELNLNGAELSSALTMLEINGHIRPAGGGNWLVV